MLNAKNCLIQVGNAEMNYITFGRGEKPLVMLPGLGDSLKGVKGMALVFAVLYRAFAKDYTVYMFSRKSPLPKGYSIREMAEEQAQVMQTRGIADAGLMGISQGGMIAMRLAAAHPELVSRLVLANTMPWCNKTIKPVLENWLRLAQVDDYKGLLYDMGERIYTPRKLKQYRPWYPLVAVLGKPKSFDSFIIQANACLGHDASAVLASIQCPTLVVGGDCDQIVGTDAALELAEQLPNCQLLICKGYGHSAYEEYPGFNARVLAFLNGES